MAQTETPQDSMSSTVADDDDSLRKRLLSRIAVAAVVIVGLLGGLAVFDTLNKPQEPALPKMAAAPAPEPVASPAPVADEKPAEEKPATEAADAKPEGEKVAVAEPERTETPIVALPAAKPLTKPAMAQHASIKPAAPLATPAKPDTQREIAAVVPEHTAPAHAPASRPLARAAEATRNFLMQVGVFSNHANAEELVTKLQTAGIPARIESHVQIGPFASRAEVDASRTKLKELGIDDGLLVRR